MNNLPMNTITNLNGKKSVVYLHTDNIEASFDEKDSINTNLNTPRTIIYKTKFLCPLFLIITFFLGINNAVSQINLGSIEDFTLFTTAGTIGNTLTATSIITGNIGVNVGAITGFEAPSVVIGNTYNASAITIQAALDLTTIVDQINNTVTTAAHIPVFGNGETLTPGVYSQAAAASLNSTLTLDGQGDTNAQFIFKIGGAFSTTAHATVVLINCASPENIFWLSGGAISMAVFTNISGNLISNPGAVSMGSGGKITGRMLSTTGAISVYGTEATNPRTSMISAITHPTCEVTTGSFQIRGYDPNIANQYTFSPSVISTSVTGLVTANPNTYILSYPNSGGCEALVVVNTGPINYWTGATSSDWNNAENWTCAVPSDINNLINIIPVVITSYPIIASEPDNSGLAKNLEIQSGASLTINNNSLRLTTILTLNGKIYLEGESQLLQDTGSVFEGSSIGSIEIDQQGTGNSFRYNYWSSPVNSGGTNFTIGDVIRDGTDPNNSIEIDFDPNATYADGAPSSPIKLSTNWMYKLEDSGLGYSAWESIGNTADVKIGQGCSMKGSNTGEDEQNYTFVGLPNNGIIELTVGSDNDHLVGNPYPSAIDADKFIDDNGLFSGTASITGTLYFWDHY
ncbi:ice-binding family protein, partial [Lacinutrix jangbogonensis]|uniref:ice-binding family protein n=1 Tax=Lacinutrix jangbogonensis TaxID=1469557 RepID=UPI00053D0E58